MQRSEDEVSPFEVSVPAQGSHVQVGRDGWRVRLRGRYSGGTLILSRGTHSNKRWRMSLRTLDKGDDVRTGEPVRVSLKGTRLGRRGAILTRILDDPVPDDSRAALAFYDRRHDAWRMVPTRISKDRRTLSAHVSHFSLWDDIQYGAGWLFDTRASEPECEGDTPDWVDSVTFLDDKNGPVRWCTGRDPRRSDVLVVKLAVNRSYGVAVRPAVKPEWVYNDLFGDGPEDFAAQLFARAYALPDNVRGAFGGQMPVMGGQQIDFGFTEAQVRNVGTGALIHVSPDVKNAIAGFTYSALDKLGGLGEGKAGKQVAAVAAIVAVAQCEGEIGNPLLEHRWADAVKGASSCLTSNLDDIVKASAAVLVRLFPTRNPAELGRLAGKVGGKLWQVWAAGAAFQLATWYADRHLIDAAFDIHVFPVVEKPRRRQPQPPPRPEPPESPASDFSQGAPFESRCVVAWPTAPTHTSQGIQMMMSCTGVPSSKFLLTEVIYNDPNFTITPGTGAVDVRGHVVDVARSEYGYSTLIVEADDIIKGN